MSGVYRYRFISDERPGAAAERVYTVRTKVWLYGGAASWYFATIPVGTSRKIRQAHRLSARAWDSLPVKARTGEVEWRTSIFPDKKAGAYLLPLKADVRRRAGIRQGDTIVLNLSLGTGAC